MFEIVKYTILSLVRSILVFLVPKTPTIKFQVSHASTIRYCICKTRPIVGWTSWWAYWTYWTDTLSWWHEVTPTCTDVVDFDTTKNTVCPQILAALLVGKAGSRFARQYPSGINVTELLQTTCLHLRFDQILPYLLISCGIHASVSTLHLELIDKLYNVHTMSDTDTFPESVRNA